MKFIKVSDRLVLDTDKIISLRIDATETKIEICMSSRHEDAMYFAFPKEKTLESLKERLEELYQQIIS